MTKNIVLCLVIATSFALQPAHAQKPEWAGNVGAKEQKKEQKHSPKLKPKKSDSSRINKAEFVHFSSEERLKIKEYYLGRSRTNSSNLREGDMKKNLPAGLEKKAERGKSLPPGWQKKIVAGQILERELYNETDELPSDLEQVLDQSVGVEHRRIGTKVIKVLEGNATVIDVIDIVDGTISGDE